MPGQKREARLRARLTRASTPFLLVVDQDVDGRVKPGHDGSGASAVNSNHDASRHIRHRHSRRRRARRRAAAREIAGDVGAGGDVCDLPRREGVAARASRLRLHRSLCRGRHHRRPRRLVRRGGAVQKAAGTADPAHRDHPEQPAPHRRQARRIHRGAFPRIRSGRSQAAADRFRLVHRRLAARPQAQRGSRALCAAAVARSVSGDGEFRADDFRQPPHHRATDGDRSCAARRRYAARRS